MQQLELLAELRQISNKSSANSRFRKRRCTAASSEDPEAKNGDLDESHSTRDTSKSFLGSTPENSKLNQYWYSKHTIEVLCNTIVEGLSLINGNKVAFLSTPSLYFSLQLEIRQHCRLFDVSLGIAKICTARHFVAEL